jgi:DNA-binding MurR/RpiR family transcriptional regulator
VRPSEDTLAARIKFISIARSNIFKLASRITQLAVIDALFVALALKHKNRTAGRLQQSAEELFKRRWV